MLNEVEGTVSVTSKLKEVKEEKKTTQELCFCVHFV